MQPVSLDVGDDDPKKTRIHLEKKFFFHAGLWEQYLFSYWHQSYKFQDSKKHSVTTKKNSPFL